MMKSLLSVREMQVSDIPLIVQYWHQSDEQLLLQMGVDPFKIPPKQQLTDYLSIQLEKPISERQSFCIILEIDHTPIGHCNTNPTTFGKNATMHLHIWNAAARKSGNGIQLLQLTLPYFFDRLQLQYLISEPYALNEAPNRTLKKAGFDFIKTYTTVPGSLNFEQSVNQWMLTAEKFKTF